MAKATTRAETHWAQAIIKALGGKDVNDASLVAVIVAWIRLEGGLGSKGAKVFNPLNLHLSSYAHGYAYIMTPSGKAPIAKFKSMKEAAKAYAWFLTHGVPATQKWAADLLVAAVRRHASPSGQWQRVVDVMGALGNLGWSGSSYYNNYGFDPTTGIPEELLKAYKGVGNVTWDPVRTVVRKEKVRTIPPVPRSLQPPRTVRNYGDPWAARAFYEGRRHIYAYDQAGLFQPEGID